jgi:hypothetical protein
VPSCCIRHTDFGNCALPHLRLNPMNTTHYRTICLASLATLSLFLLAATGVPVAQGSTDAAKSELPPVTPAIFRQPALSPDGQTLAFVHDGDLWTVPAKGGTARRLTSTQGNDQRPVYSPDGQWLAFASMKYGSFDVYVMPAQGGASRRITFGGGVEYPFGWTTDGACVLFESQVYDNGDDLWCVRIAGRASHGRSRRAAFGAQSLVHASARMASESPMWRERARARIGSAATTARTAMTCGCATSTA